MVINLKQFTLFLKPKELILYSFFGALIFCSQVAMASLPNIEPVSLFVILLAVVFGRKSLISVYIFVLLEGIFYGFGLWFVNYLYVWLILWLTAYFLRGIKQAYFWAVISALFGLAFGTLCSVPYFFIGGGSAAVAYIISGFVFDIPHCIGNAILAFLLFTPLCKALEKLKQRF